jgi:hypothetical protein
MTMNSELNPSNAALTDGAAEQNFTQHTHADSHGKRNRIIIVIEDGRVVKYIQKTINKP